MIVYLAQPYSHPDDAVRQQRFELAVRVSKILMMRGISPLSPIAHSHYMDSEPHAPFEVYQEMDEAMIRVADEMWIIGDVGWQDSRGVTSERKYAASLGKPIKLIGYDGNEWPESDELLLRHAVPMNRPRPEGRERKPS